MEEKIPRSQIESSFLLFLRQQTSILPKCAHVKSLFLEGASTTQFFLGMV